MPNFSYSNSVADLFPTVIAQAREAESAGFDTAFVMDHFYQLPGIGEPDEPMLEAYTALGALATATQSIQLSTLVTGNTYRNPPMLAKTVSTLDVVSGGRAVLGIGAGVVRARAPPIRLRIRHFHRALRETRRGAADHRSDAARREADVRRQVVPRRIGDQRAAHPQRHPGTARRRR
ncbi:LLM class flavin-dependent oxidoreductase [Antrihabitans sp. NCIMB 15449]|uniref:LLM class flavin-dependent oxidoreductase n=1 Tax=Antrihabitans spumae TaxID=3373370 RepID=A0ABW7JVK4_9NOCA